MIASNLETDVDGLFNLPSDEAAKALARQYKSAKPFPHIVLDAVLKPGVDKSTIAFPDFDWPGWSQFKDGYQYGKRVCNDITRFPASLRHLTNEACQPRFLQLLELLTGIAGIIPDPYLTGGGLHSSGPGGILIPHTDFHIYDRLEVFRRINVILYFNDDWSAEDGGALELSRRGASEPSTSILPIFGRMVIFNTDDISVHGFTKPVAQGRRRNSLALYYYTSKEAGVFSGDRSTHWQQHGATSAGHRFRVSLYKQLLFTSRAFSKLAHMVNPNMGRTAKAGVTASDEER